MPYDFDKVIDRRGTDSLKWDVKENELPMWVADMDFPTAPEILAALQKRLAHGIFGYADIPPAWYQAYDAWWSQRHGLPLERESLIFSTGVIPSISSLVRKLTTPNENVVIQTPVYNIFFNSIVNNGCRVLESPLLYKNGAYTMDFQDLETKLADPQTSLMLLCNPHNPVGRIWTAEELRRVAELAKKHHVVVISDEIHCDLTQPGRDYVPFASISPENSITCLAPTKAFNLAGLQTSALYVPDPFLRHKAWRALNTDEVAEPNAFAAVAAIAAFTQGGPWLDSLRAYLYANRTWAEDYLRAEVPSVVPVRAEATYLLWLDISALGVTGAAFAAFLREKTGLYLIGGEEYGEAGKNFLRLNLACPRSLCEEGFRRLKAGVELFKMK